MPSKAITAGAAAAWYVYKELGLRQAVAMEAVRDAGVPADVWLVYVRALSGAEERRLALLVVDGVVVDDGVDFEDYERAVKTHGPAVRLQATTSPLR